MNLHSFLLSFPQDQHRAALEQQLAAKDAEIARLRAALQAVMKHVYCGNDYTSREYENYYAALDLANAALAETPAAPLTALALPEDDVPDAAPEAK